MGIRILKNKSYVKAEEHKKLQSLKQKKLREEIKNWQIITAQDKDASDILQKIQSMDNENEKSKKEGHLSEVQKVLNTKQIDLVTIQGNLNIQSLNKLIDSHS